MKTNFTLADYMSGKPLPGKEPKEPSQRAYTYGVYLNSKREFARFLVKDAPDKVQLEPHDIILMRASFFGMFDEAKALAEKALETFKVDNQPIDFIPEDELKYRSKKVPIKRVAAITPRVGSIIEYIDESTHLGIILYLGSKRSCMLFSTTNPHWNRWARLIEREEQALLGVPYKRESYFAPVWRDNAYIQPTGKTYPDHRIEKLKEEFAYNLSKETGI